MHSSVHEEDGKSIYTNLSLSVVLLKVTGQKDFFFFILHQDSIERIYFLLIPEMLRLSSYKHFMHFLQMM